MRFSSIRLRINKPAASARTTEDASWRTTSARRANCRERPAVPVRPPSFSTPVTSGRDNCSAGRSPNRMPVTIGENGGEEQHGAVERRFIEPRQVRRPQRDDDLQSRPRDREARGGAGDRQQHALGKQLRDDLPAAGAKRGAHRDFTAPHVGARQLQVRDVRARDQQHEANRSEQDQECSAHLSRDEFLRPGSRGGRDRRGCRRAWPARNPPAPIATRPPSARSSRTSVDTPSFSRARPK